MLIGIRNVTRWVTSSSTRLPSMLPDLPAKIEAHEVITPKDLEQTYGLTGGHIFHGELALDQLFTMRPLLDWAQYRTPVAGLYLCGSGTHPGNGLTGGSGSNAAREIARDCGRPDVPCPESRAAGAATPGRLSLAPRLRSAASNCETNVPPPRAVPTTVPLHTLANVVRAVPIRRSQRLRR